MVACTRPDAGKWRGFKMRPHSRSAFGGGQATILDRGGADYAPPTLPQPPEGWGREIGENAYTGLCFEALRERKLVGAKVGLGSGRRGWAVLRGAGVGRAGLCNYLTKKTSKKRMEKTKIGC